jgi:hypothetical protein
MSAHRLQNDPDIPTGFGSYYMPMRFGGFGLMSPAGNTPLFSEQPAFQSPSDISPDESMSQRDDTDMNLDDPLWFNDSPMGLDYFNDNSQAYVARTEFSMDM